MPKILTVALVGALSLMLLAGTGTGASRVPQPQAAVPLPAISSDAVEAHAPRECDNAANVTTACTYQ